MFCWLTAYEISLNGLFCVYNLEFSFSCILLEIGWIFSLEVVLHVLRLLVFMSRIVLIFGLILVCRYSW